MNATEVIRLINTGKPFTSGFTATINKDGRPHLTWDLFVYWKGKLYICVTPKTITYYNFVQRKGVSIAITDAKGASAVFIEGEARLVGKTSELKDGLVSEIEANVSGFQLPDYTGLMFEIAPTKILTYK
jgi:uncharacterized pyridoxamine 5'-phosphate oxidase family protein